MKTWIKTNLSKITLAFAIITGSIGLILGAVACYQKWINKIFRPFLWRT